MVIPNTYNFEGQKALHEAKKRDYLRSKLRQVIRDKAWNEAERIVDENKRKQEARNHEIDKKNKRANYDEAMETTIGEMQKDKSIRKFVL